MAALEQPALGSTREAKHDSERLREQTEMGRDGAIGFVNFVTPLWEAYARNHGLEMGPPEPLPDPAP